MPKFIKEEIKDSLRVEAATLVAAKMYQQLRRKSLSSPDNQDKSKTEREKIADRVSSDEVLKAFSSSFGNKVWSPKKVKEILASIGKERNISTKEDTDEEGFDLFYDDGELDLDDSEDSIQ